jgi:hypothetical protein
VVYEGEAALVELGGALATADEGVVGVAELAEP